MLIYAKLDSDNFLLSVQEDNIIFFPAVILSFTSIVDDEFTSTSPSCAMILPTSTIPTSPTAVLLLIEIYPLFDVALLTTQTNHKTQSCCHSY